MKNFLQGKKVMLFFILFFLFLLLPSRIKESYYISVKKDIENTECSDKYKFLLTKDYIVKPNLDSYCIQQQIEGNFKVFSFDNKYFEENEDTVKISGINGQQIEIEKDGSGTYFKDDRLFFIGKNLNSVKEVSVINGNTLFSMRFNGILTSLNFDKNLDFFGFLNGNFIVYNKNKEALFSKGKGVVISSLYKNGALFFVRDNLNFRTLYYYKKTNNGFNGVYSAVFKGGIKREATLFKAGEYLWIEGQNFYDVYNLNTKNRNEVILADGFKNFDYKVSADEKYVFLLNKMAEGYEFAIYTKDGTLILKELIKENFIRMYPFEKFNKIVVNNNIYSFKIEGK